MNCLAVICFMILFSAPSEETVATVDLQKCLAAVSRPSDLIDMQADIEATDQEARILVNAAKAAEAYADDNPTSAKDRASAQALKAEFDQFRTKQQKRLSDREQKMFNVWLQKIKKAVGVVAQRDRHTVVLFERVNSEQKDPAVIQFTSGQILNGLPELAYVAKQQRIDITDAVIDELKLLPEDQNTQQSEQSDPPERR